MKYFSLPFAKLQTLPRHYESRWALCDFSFDILTCRRRRWENWCGWSQTLWDCDDVYLAYDAFIRIIYSYKKCHHRHFTFTYQVSLDLANISMLFFQEGKSIGCEKLFQFLMLFTLHRRLRHRFLLFKNYTFHILKLQLLLVFERSLLRKFVKYTGKLLCLHFTTANSILGAKKQLYNLWHMKIFKVTLKFEAQRIKETLAIHLCSIFIFTTFPSIFIIFPLKWGAFSKKQKTEQEINFN